MKLANKLADTRVTDVSERTKLSNIPALEFANTVKQFEPFCKFGARSLELMIDDRCLRIRAVYSENLQLYSSFAGDMDGDDACAVIDAKTLNAWLKTFTAKELGSLTLSIELTASNSRSETIDWSDGSSTRLRYERDGLPLIRRATFELSNGVRFELESYTFEGVEELEGCEFNDGIILNWQNGWRKAFMSALKYADKSDSDRPQLQLIASIDGKLYATNGYHLIGVPSPGYWPLEYTHVDLVNALVKLGSKAETATIERGVGLLSSLRRCMVTLGPDPATLDSASTNEIVLDYLAPKQDSEFPRVRTVIPQHTTSVTVNIKELKGLLKQAKLIAPDHTGTVRLSFDQKLGTMGVQADNPELGGFFGDMDVTFEKTKCKKLPNVGFNLNYLVSALDALGSLGGRKIKEVQLNFSTSRDPLDPLLLTADGTDAEIVVMPMRIN